MKDNLTTFSYNVLIANLHEIYSFLNKEIEKKYTKKTIIDNYSKILVTMLPIIPHYASECIEINNFKINEIWPKYNEILKDEHINMVVQINGRKKRSLNVERDISEINLLKLVKEKENLNKYLGDKKLKKVIFIKIKLLI